MPDPKKALLLRPTDAPLDEEDARVASARPDHHVADALPSKNAAGLARAHAPLRFTAAHAPLTRALVSWSAALDDAHGARFDSVGASVLVYERPSWRDRCEMTPVHAAARAAPPVARVRGEIGRLGG